MQNSGAHPALPNVRIAGPFTEEVERPSGVQHLRERCGELFRAEFDVLLYDPTSSYVEGAAEKNPMMQRG